MNILILFKIIISTIIISKVSSSNIFLWNNFYGYPQDKIFGQREKESTDLSMPNNNIINPDVNNLLKQLLMLASTLSSDKVKTEDKILTENKDVKSSSTPVFSTTPTLEPISDTTISHTTPSTLSTTLQTTTLSTTTTSIKQITPSVKPPTPSVKPPTPSVKPPSQTFHSNKMIRRNNGKRKPIQVDIKDKELSTSTSLNQKKSNCRPGEIKQAYDSQKFYFVCDDDGREFHRHQCPNNTVWLNDAFSCVVKQSDVLHDCNQEEFYPDLKDCKYFFRCFHSRLIKFQCPYDLVWNQKLLICDKPEHVSWCRGKPILLADDSYKPQSSNGSCVTRSSYVSKANSCYKFYRCQNDEWTRGQCPPGTIWNNYSNICDWPFHYQCQSKTKIIEPILRAVDDLEQQAKHDTIATHVLDKIDWICADLFEQIDKIKNLAINNYHNYNVYK